LQVEALEDRWVPTVTPTLDATTGLLSIAGDAADHAIVITEQPTPGTYQVAALDLVGGPVQVFTGVSAISVDVGSGNTTLNVVGDATAGTTLTGDLTITGSGALALSLQNNVNVAGNLALTHSGGQPLTVDVQGGGTTLGNVTITDGIGNSSVTLENGAQVAGALTLNLGDGTNEVRLQPGKGAGVSVQGPLTMTGGAGSDSLLITGSSVTGDVAADLGIGFNQVAVTDSTLGGQLSFDSNGQGETLAVQQGSVIKGDVTFTKGGDAGSSSTTVQGSVVGGNLSVSSGAGNDSVNVANASTGGIALHLGAGANNVTLDGATVNGDMVQGDTGQETVALEGNTKVFGLVSINGGAIGSMNATVADTAITGYLSVVGGAGNDSAAIVRTSVGNNLGVALGGGTDKTIVTDVKVGGSLFTQGVGDETFIVSGSQIQGYLSAFDKGAASVTATVSHTAVADFLSVISGPGNAAVSITDTSVGENCGLALGGLSDAVTIGNVAVNGNLFGSETGGEALAMEGSHVRGFVSLTGGSAATLNVAISDSTIQSFLSVINGAGGSSLDVTATAIGQNFGLALDGNATVVIQSATVAGDLFQLGQAAETLTVANTAVAGNLNCNTSSSGDGTTVNLQGDLIAGDLGLDTGAGADNILIQRTTVGGATTVDTHNGNDLVTTDGATFRGNVTLSIGNGSDTLNLQAGTKPDASNTVFLGSVAVTMGGAGDPVTLGQDAQDEAVFLGEATFEVPTPAAVNQTFARFLGGAPDITSSPI
jgi:hypothetical protein